MKVLPAVLLVLVSGVAAAEEDEWPRYGHDGRLTGRSSLRGKIRRPHVAWTFSTAGRELLVELTPAQGRRRLKLPPDEAEVDRGPRRVDVPKPPVLDTDGTGELRPAAETFHQRWAKILPDVPGVQRVSWSHTWTDKKVCRLELYAYDRGFDRPRKVWQTDPPEGNIFSPLNVVYDVDGDGVQEICVAAHYRVMIFEGTSGRKETELRYHSCRPYGWFGLADVDADGRVELITIGDFQSHVDVLAFDPKKPEPDRLSVMWRRDIETDITLRRKWPQIGPHPVVDVHGDGDSDGDRRPEIVLNLFNDTGDGQWHVVVLDAATGRTVHDLPRRYVQGKADVDRDGGCELFVTETRGPLVPTFGHLELVKFQREGPRLLWSADRSGWAVKDLPKLGADWSTTAAFGMQHVLLSGGDDLYPPAFLVHRLGEPAAEASSPGGSSGLLAMRCDRRGQPQVLWEMEGLPGEVQPMALAALDANGTVGALVRARLGVNARSTASGRAVEGRVVGGGPLGMNVSLPIASRLRPGGPVTVVVEGPGRQILAIAPPAEGEAAAKLLWQVPGRGMANGGPRYELGPLAADLDGDGGREVIVADRTAAGAARLAVYRHDGRLQWTHVFDETPGGTPTWNLPALTFWWPGRFRDPRQTDLFVNTRRGPMHSDVGHLIDGRSGRRHWMKTKAALPGQFSWGYLGNPPAAADTDGDGLDELVSLYPVCFWIAEGRSGELTAGRELASRSALPAWAAYGEPIVHDFNGDGSPEVLLDSVYILALLDRHGKPIWHGPGRDDYPTSPGQGNVGQTTSTKHALADIDGDGSFEVASAGYGDGARAIDPKSGKVLWSVAAAAPTCAKVCAADVDGRPGDELLYAAGATLVCITGDRRRGRVLWTWQGPAALSMPAVADTDGDGLAEILVQSAAGTLICLDAPPQSPEPPKAATKPPR